MPVDFTFCARWDLCGRIMFLKFIGTMVTCAGKVKYLCFNSDKKKTLVGNWLKMIGNPAKSIAVQYVRQAPVLSDCQVPQRAMQREDW